MRMFRTLTLATCAAWLCAGGAVAGDNAHYAWRYYRPGNTGIQGDYCEALWIGADGDPWIGGYDPSFEEGGVAKFAQTENRWENISNVDYPVIGHPDITGTTRVSDMIADGQGRLWLATWRSALRFDPAIGPASLVNFASDCPALADGGARDVELAPDGTLWFALLGFGGHQGGLVRHTPGTNDWHYWTGGAEPQGGNDWPQLVWSVRFVAAQPKPGGGYLIWCDPDNIAGVAWFDTGTQRFTFQEFSYTVGSMLEMPGKDSVDDAGNLWMRRLAGFKDGKAVFSLDLRRPDGTWVTPAQPALPDDSPPIWAFRAFGTQQALLVDGNSKVLRFDGATWQDFGVWREGAYTYDVNVDKGGNVWACGVGGAARRDAAGGQWRRYRVTNSSQYDLFAHDLAIDPGGGIYACANAGPGYGGMVRYDGTRWIGFNNHQYGLGVPWPFSGDNSNAVHVRPSSERVVVNPMYEYTHEFDGSSWAKLPGGSETVISYVEDSLGRLWGMGEYMSLGIYQNGGFTNFGILSWGQKLRRDPDRAGTVWAQAGYELVRTDGTYRFSRTIDDFPELTSQSDTFGGLAVDSNGVAWVGCTVMYGAGGSGGGLIRVDAGSGAYTMLRHGADWPFPGQYVSPVAVTPDGRVWMQYDTDYPYTVRGLLWWDGTNIGTFPAPPGGEPQWGGLPHGQIYDLEVKPIPGGYELWMQCASRGIAVLTVTYPCYPDCDKSGELDIDDFICFQTLFGLGDPGADCDQSGELDIDDFICFQTAFGVGCP